ncbi:hypothetical protein HPG69_005939 [Diceros bicornis minor]|uniref:Uncharacterized protein n=1 Tax=Diceros bicornis minor TaxID=77932 RepID=A0A7J7ETC3_DICBM|nr:hypothetical protein HPG69_005939 [Diceros bicornis minor]
MHALQINTGLWKYQPTQASGYHFCVELSASVRSWPETPALKICQENIILRILTKPKEKELVKKQWKQYHSGEEREKLQQLLQRVEPQEMAQLTQRRQQELRLALRWGGGLRPSRATGLLVALAENVKELTRSKKLESFLSQKMCRNAGKDRRHLPLSKE